MATPLIPRTLGPTAPAASPLRMTPPAEALRWAAGVVGSPVEATRPLPGGAATALHVLEHELPGGRGWFVLRRYVRSDVNLANPYLAQREARTLTLLADSGLPVPRLLALDATGAEAGHPALLMSYLPGSVVWDPTDLDAWVQSLADLAVDLHDLPVPRPGTLQEHRPIPVGSVEPPPWSQRPRLWERAVELALGPGPQEDVALLHRDLHPGNVLFLDGRVSGLVDWQTAGVGPPSVDVGRCRVTLLRRFGLHTAERFALAWQDATGEVYHPWVDVNSLVEVIDDLRVSPPPAGGDAVEEALARAVALLG